MANIRRVNSPTEFDQYLKLITQLSNAETKEFCDYHPEPNCEVFVAEHAGELVGTSSVWTLYKWHAKKPVALIEDVVVNPDYQGMGLGRRLVDRCVEYARSRQAYKVVLSCSDDNVPFYERCGFYRHENTMRLDLGD